MVDLGNGSFCGAIAVAEQVQRTKLAPNYAAQAEGIALWSYRREQTVQ